MSEKPAQPDVSCRMIGNVTIEMMACPAAADGSGQVPIRKVEPASVLLPRAEPLSILPGIAKAR